MAGSRPNKEAKGQVGSLRTVTLQNDQKIITQPDFQACLWQFLSALYTESCRPIEKDGTQVMQKTVGFCVKRSPSILKDGGYGVKVVSGMIPAGVITSLYPGLIYEPQDPVLLQSIGNPFIFKCADGTLIDGNDKGISRSLYRSCRKRDSCWPIPSCDESWLTPHPFNPWNVGQYVNNHTKDHPANVCYEEFEIPDDFPARLRQFLPNIFFTSNAYNDIPRNLRVVALISLRDIYCGEELFSSYFTLVK